MMRISKQLAVSILCASLHTAAGCAQAGAPAVQPASPENVNERVQQLLAKVKKSLRPLEGGTFEMGDWGYAESGRYFDFEKDSRPLHKVTMDGFSMMAYKVTYDDFDVFTDATGNERVDMDRIRITDRAPKRPAGVSWYGAKAYCEWFAKKTNLPFDLPTEAQWEYAARSGGKRTLFATDNGKIERGRNFPDEWKHAEREPPLSDVGSFPPNPAGLYGMSEDTSEWVGDWFDENYYKVSSGKNPTGPGTGTMKVMRGSVGGSAEISAAVFMRTKELPQTLRATYPNGIAGPEVMVPFSGYSSYKSDNFRCVVNAPSKPN
jgi:formylglycine-generating enzyme required for sulfatase activity